jgi:hypothetical protein
VGFIHGVMNTDNMALSGETIDYGPCAFMDAYDPATVFSSIDHQGRYAYGNQPRRIAQWNLARLAETLLPLLRHLSAAGATSPGGGPHERRRHRQRLGPLSGCRLAELQDVALRVHPVAGAEPAHRPFLAVTHTNRRQQSPLPRRRRLRDRGLSSFLSRLWANSDTTSRSRKLACASIRPPSSAHASWRAASAGSGSVFCASSASFNSALALASSRSPRRYAAPMKAAPLFSRSSSNGRSSSCPALTCLASSAVFTSSAATHSAVCHCWSDDAAARVARAGSDVSPSVMASKSR